MNINYYNKFSVRNLNSSSIEIQLKLFETYKKQCDFQLKFNSNLKQTQGVLFSQRITIYLLYYNYYILYIERKIKA
jgi:hypothetical protein